MPDAFIDSIKVTKSHIPAENILARIEILMGKLKYSVANEPKPQLKCGQPTSSKDTISRKMKSVKFNAPKEHASEENTNVKGLNDELITPVDASIEQLSHEIVPVHSNGEITINYIDKDKIWDRNTTLINDDFSFQVTMDIISNDEDQRHNMCDTPTWHLCVRKGCHKTVDFKLD